jgi:ribosomal-protein-alanine N-acetyltransferase
MRITFDARTQRFSRKDACSGTLNQEFNISNPEIRGFLVRRANALDLPAIKVLEQHSAMAAHWNQELYENLVSASSPRIVLVIENTSNQSILGFLITRTIGREWEIENIVIGEQSQRHGLGRQLLGEVLRHARHRGAEAIFLEVRDSNFAAKALYENLNFKQIGRRKSYYRDPEEDAVLYRLQFP